MVTTGPDALAAVWAAELPRELARMLAKALRTGPQAVQALKAVAVLPASLAAVQDALELAKAGDGPYASGALTARIDALANEPDVTPVWTGPDSHQPGGRLTVAVLADLISEARSEILLVSYATFPDAEVRAAMGAAAAKGVRVTTLFEREADNPHYSGHADPFPQLAARRLYWPGEHRPPGAAMHAKILVVDRHTALVGSANLTGPGLEKNLECGLLVRGGRVPGEIAGYILGLKDLHEGQQPERPPLWAEQREGSARAHGHHHCDSQRGAVPGTCDTA